MDRRHAIAQGCAAEVGDGEAGLGVRTESHRSEIQTSRQHSQLRGPEARAGDSVGAVTAVAGEYNDIAEADGIGGSEGDDHEASRSRRQAEGSAALNAKGRGRGSSSGQSESAIVYNLKILGVGLAEDNRAKIQIGRAKAQQRRRIGYGDVIGARQG